MRDSNKNTIEIWALLVLTIVAAYGAKPNRKSTTPSSAVISDGFVVIVSLSALTTGFNTVGIGKHLVQLIKTNGSAGITLGTMKTSNLQSAHKVYR